MVIETQRWHSCHPRLLGDFRVFLGPHSRKNQSAQLRNNRPDQGPHQVHRQPQNSLGELLRFRFLERE